MRTIGISLAALALGFLSAGAAPGADASKGEPAVFVADANQVPEEKFPWGSLKWLCNGTLSPGAAQTVGIAEGLPGQTNPVHFHPNCEEVLYVISGRGTHFSEGRAIELKPGVTIRIPAGVKHNMRNTGTEPIRCLISFSSGDRKTVFLDEKGSK